MLSHSAKEAQEHIDSKTCGLMASRISSSTCVLGVDLLVWGRHIVLSCALYVMDVLCVAAARLSYSQHAVLAVESLCTIFKCIKMLHVAS